MSLRIINAGIADRVVCGPQWGGGRTGKPAGGFMDPISAGLANGLLGKDAASSLIEIHFPASQFLFQSDALICICGADFTPLLNGYPLPLHHPVAVKKGSVLHFSKKVFGAWCYLAVYPSIHMQASSGAEVLKKDDSIDFDNALDLSAVLKNDHHHVLPWSAGETVRSQKQIQCVMGSEWYTLTKEAQEIFQQYPFVLANDESRKAYRLMGPPLTQRQQHETVFAGVAFGTIQLLPDNQLSVLMSAHDTTSAHPRIAHVITAHMPLLAQKNPNDTVSFEMTDLATAEEKILKQFTYLEEIRMGAAYRLAEMKLKREEF